MLSEYCSAHEVSCVIHQIQNFTESYKHVCSFKNTDVKGGFTCLDHKSQIIV